MLWDLLCEYEFDAPGQVDVPKVEEKVMYECRRMIALYCSC